MKSLNHSLNIEIALLQVEYPRQHNFSVELCLLFLFVLVVWNLVASLITHHSERWVLRKLIFVSVFHQDNSHIIQVCLVSNLLRFHVLHLLRWSDYILLEFLKCLRFIVFHVIPNWRMTESFQAHVQIELLLELAGKLFRSILVSHLLW